MTGGQLEYMASCDHRSACARHATMHAQFGTDSYDWCLCATCPLHTSENAELRERVAELEELLPENGRWYRAETVEAYVAEIAKLRKLIAEMWF